MQYNFSEATWHRSSYSSANGQCVEVAKRLDGIVPVRDSKVPTKPCLIFPADAWTTFVETLKADGVTTP